MRKQSAMGSSKYEFEPENFTKDIRNKKRVADQFKKDLKDVLYCHYFYHDGNYLSNKAKREILIEVHKEFLDKFSL